MHRTKTDERSLKGRLAASRANRKNRLLQHDSLNLIQADLVCRPVVELGRASALVGGDPRGIFDRAAVQEVRSNTSCAPGVAAQTLRKSWAPGMAFHQAQYVVLVHARRRE